MPTSIRCQICRDYMVSIADLICHRCRAASADRDIVTKLARDLQQYRFVVGTRLNDTKRFRMALRAAAQAAGAEPIEGPARVSILAQRSPYDEGPLAASRLVVDMLRGVAIGPHTDLHSFEATVIPGGYMMTIVEARRLFDDEMSGADGVSKVIGL